MAHLLLICMPRIATNCNTAVVPRSTRDCGVAALVISLLPRICCGLVSVQIHVWRAHQGFWGETGALRDHGSHEEGGMPPNQGRPGSHQRSRNRSWGGPGPLRDRLNPSARHQCPMASHHQVECHLRAFGLRCSESLSTRLCCNLQPISAHR